MDEDDDATLTDESLSDELWDWMGIAGLNPANAGLAQLNPSPYAASDAAAVDNAVTEGLGAAKTAALAAVGLSPSDTAIPIWGWAALLIVILFLVAYITREVAG